MPKFNSSVVLNTVIAGLLIYAAVEAYTAYKQKSLTTQA
jgi:hypothetical protein